MEGFITRHSESKEEGVVQRFSNKLIKRVVKTAASAEVYQWTIKTYFSSNQALEAFHAEKRRAKGKHFEILAFDSMTSKPVRKWRIGKTHKFSGKVEVIGRKIPLDSQEEGHGKE